MDHNCSCSSFSLHGILFLLLAERMLSLSSSQVRYWSLDLWAGVYWKQMDRSKKNTENRKKLLVNHIAGSKSFVRLRYELRNLETQEEPDRVKFYFHSHYQSNKHRWVTPQTEQLYEQMTTLQSQPTPDGVDPLTADQICDRVLGTRSGYIRGLGHGERSNSSFTSGQATRAEVEETRRRAEIAESRAEVAERRTEQLVEEMDGMRTRQSQMETMLQSLMSHFSPSGDTPN